MPSEIQPLQRRAVLEDLREIAIDPARTDNEAIRDIIVRLNEALRS